VRFRTEILVMTADAIDVGRLGRVVVDPVTQATTHLVVHRASRRGQDRIAPVGLIADVREDCLRLQLPAVALADLSCFDETHYVPAEAPEALSSYEAHRYAPALYWYPPTEDGEALTTIPLVALDYRGALGQSGLIRGACAPQPGARVQSQDHHDVGRIVEVLHAAGRRPAHPTHLVVGGGVLPRRHKLIPAHWIRKVADDEVHLAVTAALVERLGDYRV
jgi:hypothetical protein